MAALLALSPKAASAAPADTLAIVPSVVADTTARRVARGSGGWTEQPRVVMLRSLLLPGWGQFHNRAYVKAALVAGSEGAFGVILWKDWRELDRLSAEVERERVGGDDRGYETAVSRYNGRLDTYVSRQWLFAGVLAYALVDAYVDAHFRDFDIEFQTDPALPDGAPPNLGRPARGRTGGAHSARIALRWNF